MASQVACCAYAETCRVDVDRPSTGRMEREFSPVLNAPINVKPAGGGGAGHRGGI